MNVVILAAGKGTRMGELTLTTPKPLLSKNGKTLLEHKFDALPAHTSHIILVIGYLGHKIKDFFGDFYKRGDHHIPITYIEQKEMLGTGDALWQAQDILKLNNRSIENNSNHNLKNNSFMVLMGDDIYHTNDLHNLSQHDFAVLIEDAKPGMKSGKCIIDSEGYLKNIIEDTTGDLPGGMYTGACMLPLSVFEVPKVLLPGGKEYGLPQTFVQLAHTEKIKALYSTEWIRVTAPEDLI